jgi:hypothetical protein
VGAREGLEGGGVAVLGTPEQAHLVEAAAQAGPDLPAVRGDQLVLEARGGGGQRVGRLLGEEGRSAGLQAGGSGEQDHRGDRPPHGDS